MLRTLYYALPPQARFWARKLYYLPKDLFRRQEELMPPEGMIYTGSGDFLQQGKQWLAFFQSVGLQPQHRFLDIGSGIGRIAIPLTQYLTTEYQGFDAVKQGVDWCESHIANRFPHFHFQYVDLFNDLYKADGLRAETYPFPYPPNHFDFSCAISVFTHMLPAEVANYLHQSRLVLTEGGILVGTFFVLNDASRQAMQAGKTSFNFPYPHDNYSLMNERVKGANVAFEESYLDALVAQSGLETLAKHPGYWSHGNKENCLDFQDVWVLRKPSL